MKPRTKLVLGFVLLFLFGALAGSFISIGCRRHFMFRPSPPNEAEMVVRIQKRLMTELQLTPEQQKQIEPIIHQRCQQVIAVHRETMRKVDKIIKNTNDQIENQLTPKQKVKLSNLEKRRRARFHHEFPHHSSQNRP